jgi:Family of unknown function (DUF6334)
MLDTLAQVIDDGGRLIAVTYALFEGNPGFVTGCVLRFEGLTATFRAVGADDTLAAEIGGSDPGPDEEVANVSGSAPWAGCVGLGIHWGWRLTNQQGYTDGVRLEFGEPGGPPRAVVELLVVASVSRVFTAAEVSAAEPVVAPDPRRQ